MTLIATGAMRRRRPLLNLVVDGNSISTSLSSTRGTLDKHIIIHEPVASYAPKITSCFAVSGHLWSRMDAQDGALVDAAWVDGALNVLVAWETTNSIVFGPIVAGYTRPVEQTLAALKTYMAHRREAHPGWKIIHVETLPYGGRPADALKNEQLLAVDMAVRGNMSEYQVDASVNLRQHPAFAHDGTAAAPFEAYPTFWHEGSTPYLHPKTAGKDALTAYIAEAIGEYL